MNLVTLENITHQYSERVLLDGAQLLINEGDRIGLLGRNGSGKSTLLRLIAGLESPDAGTMTVWGHVRLRYLPQNPQLDPALTVLDTLFQTDSPIMRLLHDYELAAERLTQAPADPQRQMALAQLGEKMDRLNGWTAEARAKSILSRLGIDQFDVPVGRLSGGMQKRVALAQALLDPADLLLLDEPTNHIDADTIDWLEETLLAVPALLMVTHDRYFLDRVCNRIVELDRRDLVAYPGNYTEFLRRRAERHERLAAAETKRQVLLRQELEWLRRGVKARGTKQKFRKQRVDELLQLREDRGEQEIAWLLAQSRRLGKKVLRVHGLSKAYGDNVLFDGLDFTLERGDRLGIIGPNGSGKTTFLDLMAGRVAPDGGAIEWGETVALGYYDQHGDDLKDHMRVLDFIEEDAALIRTRTGERVSAAQMLEWFLFPRPQQRALIGSLSGGERRRLYLLHILIHQPNVLFLDEPTNDLDIETLQVLEQFLDHFAGCVIIVSHDRYFLDRTVDFLFSLEDGVVGTRFPAPFAAYRERVAARLAAANASRAADAAAEKGRRSADVTPADAGSADATSAPRALSWKEARELEALDTTLEALTARKRSLEAEINGIGGDYARLTELTAALEAVSAELDAAETRWLELSLRA